MSRGGRAYGGRHISAKLALVLAGAATAAACGTGMPSASSSSTTKSSVASTSTTTVPCATRPSTGTDKTAQLTVNPGTCLKGRQTVKIIGSGLTPNNPGGLAECNDASGQPTVTVEGNQVPVSCTNPVAQAVITNPDRSLDATFVIITGITGPPASGTDSAHTQALDDARSYPCPPTAAQAAAGATCNIAFGDASGDQVSIPISFVPNVAPTSTKPGSTLSPSSELGGL